MKRSPSPDISRMAPTPSINFKIPQQQSYQSKPQSISMNYQSQKSLQPVHFSHPQQQQQPIRTIQSNITKQ